MITTPATHLTLGVKTYTCSVCSETYTEDVPKTTAHEYGTLIPRVEPGCTDTGTLAHYHCSCGMDFDENYEILNTLTIPALGHYVEESSTTLVDSISTTNHTQFPFTSSVENGEKIWCSTNKGNSTTSIFTIRALYNCSLVLKYSVSSERTYDTLIILKNSTTVDTISGTVNWKTITITLSAGDIVYIKYTKDNSQFSGADEGYFVISSCPQTEITTITRTPTDDITPTCNENVVCSDCKQEIKPSLGHDTVPHAAQQVTCTEIGWDAYETCSRCDYSTYVEIPATGHSHGEWQKHNAEQHKRVCACTNVEYADHDWDDGVITTPATHLEIGTKTYTCSDCGETKTEDVPKTTAHEYGKWQKHNATQHKRECACIDVEYADHNWNNGVITTPATHLELGVKTYTCSDCGETKTEDVPKTTAHEYGEWQKHDAEQHKHECACTDVEYADHNWNGGVVSKAATHLEEGLLTFTCVGCGETQTRTIQKIAQHSYGAWTTIKEATKDAAGVQERSCACGHTDSKEIPQLESNVGVVIAIVSGSAVALGGGGFALYWFVFRKKKLI